MTSERIRALRLQLDESTIHHLLSKVLLLSLEKAVENGGLSGSTVTKLNKVLQFGNLNEYLDVAEPANEFSTGFQALLGILKNPEYEQRAKLTNEERQAVLDELRGILSMKNQLVYQIFGRYLQSDSAGATEENLKNLVRCLELSKTPPLMWNQQKEISEDIRKCYEEIGKCQAMLESLVDIKLQAGEPLFTNVKKANNLNAEATLTKSKELLSDIKNEILSNEGAAALEIIHTKQKEVMEMKKLEIKRLREELAQYESLKNDGFESVLEEYLLVLRQRRDKEKLKEEYVTGFDNLKEG